MDEYDIDPFWDEDDIDEYEEEGEGMRTEKEAASFEDGVQQLREFLFDTANPISWGVVMQEGDKFSFHSRTSQPCYGEMRKYGKKGNSTRPTDGKPSDLHDPFPAGTPVAIGAHTICHVDSHHAIGKEYGFEGILDFMLEKFSPWRHCTQHAERLFKEGKTVGVLLEDTSIDPTAMVQFFMSLKNLVRGGANNVFSYAIELTGISPLDAFLLTRAITVVKDYSYTRGVSASLSPILAVPGYDAYTLSLGFDIKRFVSGEIDTGLSKGRTFRDGEDYNRPELHKVFGHDSTFMKDLRGEATSLLTKRDKKDIDGFIKEFAPIVVEARTTATA